MQAAHEREASVGAQGEQGAEGGHTAGVGETQAARHVLAVRRPVQPLQAPVVYG